MLGLIYPECPAPHTSLLNNKEMVIYQNLYSHFYTTKHQTLKDSQTYAMMYVLKNKYHGLKYSEKDENKLSALSH